MKTSYRYLRTESKIEFWEQEMHTEYTLKIEFHTPNKEALATFVRALREAGKELAAQAIILGEGTPTLSLTVENNQIGVKKLKVFTEDA